MRATHYVYLLYSIGIVEKRVTTCVDLSEGPKNYDLNACESFITSVTTKKFHCELKIENFFGTVSVGVDGCSCLSFSTLRVSVTANTARADWGISRGGYYL